MRRNAAVCCLAFKSLTEVTRLINYVISKSQFFSHTSLNPVILPPPSWNPHGSSAKLQNTRAIFELQIHLPLNKLSWAWEIPQKCNIFSTLYDYILYSGPINLNRDIHTPLSSEQSKSVNQINMPLYRQSVSSSGSCSVWFPTIASVHLTFCSTFIESTFSKNKWKGDKSQRSCHITSLGF